MRPNPDRVLQGVAISLMVEVAPQIGTPYGQQTAGIAGSLAFMLSQEVDRLADRLLAENRAIVALALEALPLIHDGALGERMAGSPAELETPNIRVGTLQAANDRLRSLLVDFHAAVEALAGPEAKAMNERIWDELRESTRRRHLQVLRG